MKMTKHHSVYWLLLGVLGCGPEVSVDSLDQLGWAPEKPADVVPKRLDPAPNRAALRASSAEARTVESLFSADRCLLCGRETGFLPRPELRLVAAVDDVVVLAWEPIEGAQAYTLEAYAFDQDGVVGSHSWKTDKTSLSLTLDLERTYVFQVVAWGTDGKRRSAPSTSLRVDL